MFEEVNFFLKKVVFFVKVIGEKFGIKLSDVEKMILEYIEGVVE